MKLKTLIVFAFLAQISMAQEHVNPCAFDNLVNNEYIITSEKKIQLAVQNLEKTDHNRVIPVVVHVFHTGGNENISDAQIQSQIDILNEDFGKISGSNGDGAGVDTKVRFSLAKIDPNGNCTNGVVRVYSALTNHKTYERSLLKELSFWDNTKYLNIYIVKSITGSTLGYSSFPGGPSAEDGAVIRHDYFGKIGTASATLGRTTTHEIGHWFGLYHTFNNKCGTDLCTDGDYVCDTPPVLTANFGCPSINSCSNDIPDVPDLIANYMDYTDDVCKSMFTKGQADRINATLSSIRTLISSNDNLIATGCDTNYVAPATCPIVANFNSLNSSVCVNNTVSFVDVSLNGATNWKWYFKNGVPSTSTLQNPTVTYPTLGNFEVSLVVSNASSSDSISKVNFVTVSDPGIGRSLPFQENFDSAIFPPNGISINNPDGQVQWELDSMAFTSASHSIKINNLINTNYGTIDEIILPFFDLSSSLNTPYLRFKWAYAKSDALYSDEMIVQLSTDCGVTWNQVLYKTGTNLATAPTQTTPFIPLETQWKNASISLSNYSSKKYVLIKIVNVTDGGNNLYIDDISVGDKSLSLNEVELGIFEIYPNPNNGLFKILFDDTKIETPNLKIMSFDGKLVFESIISSTSQELNLSELPNGIYFINLLTDKGIQIKPIVINK